MKREARKKGTPAARLLELAALDVQVARSVAKSKYAPPDVLETLSRSGDMPTRKAVAANPVTPLALLEKLARDRQWTVLKALATNPAAPTHLLVQLARHKRDTVRYAIFSRPSGTIPGEVLEAFLHSGRMEDRRQLAQQTHLPGHIVQTLSADPDAEIQFHLAFANAKHLPQDLLERCANSQDPHLRATVARYLKNPATLATLLHDPDMTVQAAAANNIHTPAEALAQASQTLHTQLSQQDSLPNRTQTHFLNALLYNPQTPKQIRQELQSQLYRPLKQLIKAEQRIKLAAT